MNSNAEKLTAEKLTALAELQSIRLVAASYGTSIADKAEAGKIVIVFDKQLTSKFDTEHPDVFRIHIDFSLNIVPKGSEDPVVWIEASYELQYQTPRGVEVSAQELDIFGEGTAIFNAWPYLREFVQSSLCRMNLPQITLPLLRRRAAAEGEEALHVKKRRASSGKSSSF